MSIEKDEGYTTIVAQATPIGIGGVGIIRISGQQVKDMMLPFLGKKLKPKEVYLVNFLTQNQQILDQGLAIYFEAPHSFTGEDVLELQAHGSQIVLDNLLKRAIELGARIARPGEFSERAFLNHKIDLTQAEAICDLINASSQQAAYLAMSSLQGEFAKYINTLLEQLIKLRIEVESAIDFTEEEIDFISFSGIAEKVTELLVSIKTIYHNAQQGVLLQEGISVVIAGRPNVGKSSLLNWFCGYDCAIVTPVPGTTRDVLREYINLDGLPLHIVDTAGLRDSGDAIEQEGIKRARQEINKADLVLLVTDDEEKITSSLFHDLIAESILEVPRSKLQYGIEKVIIIRNKIDLMEQSAQIVNKNGIDVVYISVKTGEGLDLLRDYLKAKVGFNTGVEGKFMARRRHLEALTKVEQFLLQAQQQKSIELLAEDLRQAQNSLGEITGKFYTDDLLAKIFSTFCVGK
jgi:tRNA modification GTPase